MIVVAGQRIDGSDTYDELERLIARVLGEDWASSYPTHLSIVEGGPLQTKLSETADVFSSTIERLSEALEGRQYIFHNNTSSGLLEALLKDDKLASLCKGITYTCGPCLRGGTLVLGANARWNTEAFFESIRLCEEQDVPLIFVHGSLQMWTRHTLTQLPGWAETMLLPVRDRHQQFQYQKMTRFGMAMPLVWAFRAYGAVTGSSGDDLRAYARSIIDKTRYGPAEGDPLKSDDLTKWAIEEEEDYDDISPDAAAARFGSIAANLKCTLANTVGDVSACIFDDRKAFVAAKMGNIRFVGETLKAEIGNGKSVYIVASAGEEALLEAWDRIKQERQTSAPGSFEILDSELKKEWKAYSGLVRRLLEKALEGSKSFPAGTEAILREALENLENGEMARRCAET